MEYEILEDVLKESPKSFDEVETLPLYKVLLILGGYLAMGLGFFHFVVMIITELDPITVFHFIVNLLFGFGLLLGNHMISKDLKRWAVLSIIFSLVLIALGGVVGAISGLIGTLGSILALLTTVDESLDI